MNKPTLVELQLAHETKYVQKPDGRWTWKCKCGDEAEDFATWEQCHAKTREHWADRILLAFSHETDELRRRRQVTQAELDAVMAEFRAHLWRALEKKGRGAFASPHETLGALMEEQKELVDAIHANKPSWIRGELMDIATSALFGVASLSSPSSSE